MVCIDVSMSISVIDHFDLVANQSPAQVGMLSSSQEEVKPQELIAVETRVVYRIESNNENGDCRASDRQREGVRESPGCAGRWL